MVIHLSELWLWLTAAAAAARATRAALTWLAVAVVALSALAVAVAATALQADHQPVFLVQRQSALATPSATLVLVVAHMQMEALATQSLAALLVAALRTLLTLTTASLADRQFLVALAAGAEAALITMTFQKAVAQAALAATTPLVAAHQEALLA